MQPVQNADLKRFGATVRAIRLQTGISQEELADRSGTHRTYISGVESGNRNLGLLNLFRIAKALGVTPAELLAKTFPPESQP